DLPPLLKFPSDSQIDPPEEQLLLLDKLKIRGSKSPSRKAHFNDRHLWSAEEVHAVLCNDALPTIRVTYGRYPIYAVTLIFPVNLPPLSMSFSPFGQIFDEHQVSVSPSPELPIHCFVLTLQDEAEKKKKTPIFLASTATSPLMILIRSGLMLMLSGPRQ